jgi:hypothetical protein
MPLFPPDTNATESDSAQVISVGRRSIRSMPPPIPTPTM